MSELKLRPTNPELREPANRQTRERQSAQNRELDNSPFPHRSWLSSLNRLRQNLPKSGGHAFDFDARCRLGDAEQRPSGQVRIETAEGQWPNDFFPQQFRIHQLHRPWQLDDEFVEKRAGERPPHAVNLLEFFECKARLRKILRR